MGEREVDSLQLLLCCRCVRGSCRSDRQAPSIYPICTTVGGWRDRWTDDRSCFRRIALYLAQAQDRHGARLWLCYCVLVEKGICVVDVWFASSECAEAAGLGGWGQEAWLSTLLGISRV